MDFYYKNVSVMIMYGFVDIRDVERPFYTLHLIFIDGINAMSFFDFFFFFRGEWGVTCHYIPFYVD